MMTSLMNWRNKYSPIKPTYLDDVDRVLAGDVFQVQHLGYNKISGNAECTVREILSRYSLKRGQMASNQELIIDAMSLHCIRIALINHWYYLTFLYLLL